MGSSDEGEQEDDAPKDSSRIITTPAPSHGTRSFALYTPSQLAESPVTSMGNITSDTPTAEIDVPMPPEWVVFVKFGPPANAECDPIFLVEQIEDPSSANSKQSYSRKKQRRDAADRSAYEREGSDRASTRSQKDSDTTAEEDMPLMQLNTILKDEQLVASYEKLIQLAETVEEKDELIKEYRKCLRSVILKNSQV